MAVNYTLRNPNAPIPNTPQERIADQALVNSFVVLKAARGRGAELVEEISGISKFWRRKDGWVLPQLRSNWTQRQERTGRLIAGSQKERLGIGRPWRWRAEACQSSAIDRWLEQHGWKEVNSVDLDLFRNCSVRYDLIVLKNWKKVLHDSPALQHEPV